MAKREEKKKERERRKEKRKDNFNRSATPPPLSINPANC